MVSKRILRAAVVVFSIIGYLMVAGATTAYIRKGCGEGNYGCQSTAFMQGMYWPIYWPTHAGYSMVSDGND